MAVDLHVHLDLPVATRPTADGSRQLVIDLWIPVAERLVPVVHYVHGGGWRRGTQYRPPFQPRLFDEGIAIASSTYRFGQEEPFPACLEDCLLMQRWLRENGRRYNLDTSRIGLWGISAGGHLTPLMACHLAAEEQVRCVVDWCGPTDLSRIPADEDPGEDAIEIVSNLLGGPVGERLDLAREASPLHQAHGGLPPHLIVHGAQDDLVRLWHAESYHARLLKLGVPSELVVNPEVGHNLGSAMEVKATRAFLVKHLLGSV